MTEPFTLRIHISLATNNKYKCVKRMLWNMGHFGNYLICFIFKRFRCNRNLLKIVFLLLVLSLILLFSFLSAKLNCRLYLLKNCYTYSLQISHTGRPGHVSSCARFIFRVIRIASRNLECIMDFQFSLHISTVMIRSSVLIPLYVDLY